MEIKFKVIVRIYRNKKSRTSGIFVIAIGPDSYRDEPITVPIFIGNYPVL
ncbi:hypothetical protein [Nonlabens spongiae]|nr:hypothetical protein [Nonlabens spongiae]